MERALMHCANAYNLPKRLRARGRVARTNSTSNTAFRGFGAPQGMVAFEAAVEQAAAALGVAPELLREGSLVRRGGGELSFLFLKISPLLFFERKEKQKGSPFFPLPFSSFFPTNPIRNNKTDPRRRHDALRNPRQGLPGAGLLGRVPSELRLRRPPAGDRGFQQEQPV